MSQSTRSPLTRVSLDLNLNELGEVVETFGPELLVAMGWQEDVRSPGNARRWRKPESGWYIYHSGRPDFPWGYAHVLDNREYGEVASLSRALAGIHFGDTTDMGD